MGLTVDGFPKLFVHSLPDLNPFLIVLAPSKVRQSSVNDVLAVVGIRWYRIWLVLQL